MKKVIKFFFLLIPGWVIGAPLIQELATYKARIFVNGAPGSSYGEGLKPGYKELDWVVPGPFYRMFYNSAGKIVAVFGSTDQGNTEFLLRDDGSVLVARLLNDVWEIGIGHVLFKDKIDFFVFEKNAQTTDPMYFSNVLTYSNIPSILGYVLPPKHTESIRKDLNTQFDANYPILLNPSCIVSKGDGKYYLGSGYVLRLDDQGKTALFACDVRGRLSRMYLADKVNVVAGGVWSNPSNYPKRSTSAFFSYANPDSNRVVLNNYRPDGSISLVHCYFADRKLPCERDCFFTFIRPMDGYAMQFALINDRVFFCGHQKNVCYPDTNNGYIYKAISSTMFDDSKGTPAVYQGAWATTWLPLSIKLADAERNDFLKLLLQQNSFGDSPASLSKDSGWGIYSIRRYKYLPDAVKSNSNHYSPYVLDGVAYRVFNFSDYTAASSIADCSFYVMDPRTEKVEGSTDDVLLVRSKPLFGNLQSRDWKVQHQWISAIWSKGLGSSAWPLELVAGGSLGNAVSIKDVSLEIILNNLLSIGSFKIIFDQDKGIDLIPGIKVGITSANSLSLNAVNKRRSNYVLKNSYGTSDGEVFIGF